MPTRFTKIDDLTRGDHFFLREEDVCWHIGDYKARQGFIAGATNDLIQNLKKPMDRQGRPEWRYKTGAIDSAAQMMRESFGQHGFSSGTVIPTPPSKIRTDPLYDARLSQILTKAAATFDVDVRELVYQAHDLGAAHDGERASIDQLIENYRIDEALTAALRNNTAFIFDDVLTTGRHYRAMKAKILGRFPEARVIGICLARRVIPKPEGGGA